MQLQIIYRDDHIIAVNKPNGLLVHRTFLAADAYNFALQILRDQIGRKVYPSHRIDRKTSGVLLFTLDKEYDRLFQSLFAQNRIRKIYLAIVRGYTEDAGTIDYPLKRHDGVFQNSVTRFETLDRTEIKIPSGKHNTSRYSLVKIMPLTGRMHQIRRHFAHILHPIIGDRPHGCNKQNRIFKETWGLTTMLLHAFSLEFSHPAHHETIIICASLPEEFKRIAAILELPSDFDQD